MNESGAQLARVQALTPDDPERVGGFSLRGRIGSGGMGQVYLAYTPGGRAVK
ncbi:hypothetical protein [Streptomyces luteolus]|uniref:Serine/threonine protein kinase n=1 Tax=Streptomyces luteolus TaxID=3043615 RepID=A0ABT6SSR1_9ACTN|nr:hypothetical protein [Streptomyces sp. B-S-A12]MDI3417687.1 hypothetical protein [Streptomyces sp. B-S-A12]